MGAAAYLHARALELVSLGLCPAPTERVHSRIEVPQRSLYENTRPMSYHRPVKDV